MINLEQAEGGSSVSWEGKLNQLKGFIETSFNEHSTHLEIYDNKLDKLFSNALEENMRALEDKINLKVEQVDHRIDMICNRLKNIRKAQIGKPN